MIKKPADELVVRLAKIHDEGIENILQDYLNEYAEYGWDSICTTLADINATIDRIMTELKYSAVKEDFGIGGKYQW
mgnify:CR=1 FL=1